ncbi:26S proteasome non-ATPase regulatory subunit 14 [Amphibalanus amphitrite]|uniref:26S proteasome non-ATPase regulatory subunit 14 n=1 Tax=Amphibalanus amphitrite TaxID=1232801 RepID=A0A6A4X0B5_AMPAM|nr:26S proteasome non-ATPase regulatory subunit 14 [Amphibalanus amphitrite]
MKLRCCLAMDRILRLSGGMPNLGQQAPSGDGPTVDTAEQVYISSLALLKMLKHGRAGVPMEVMGLMLGEFVDEYTVRVIDVFAMPQSGTWRIRGGRGPGSVKGKVVIDAFRLINPNVMVLGQEPRQTTSNLGHLQKPSLPALIHGLNRHYYSISINYRKNELEQRMLMNLNKETWMDGLQLQDYRQHCDVNEKTVKQMLDLAVNYQKSLEDEESMTPEQLAIKNVGKMDPKRHLEEKVGTLMTSNIVQCLGAMLDTVVFK